jgi:hypothetical protein
VDVPEDDDDVLDPVEPLEVEELDPPVPVAPPAPVEWFEEQARREITADASSVGAIVLCMGVT